jgi:hypothetical protein
VGEASCAGSACVIDACANGYAECNDVAGDGCEVLLDDDYGTCTGASDLGSVSGDGAPATLSRAASGEAWYRFRVTDDVGSGSPPNLSARVRLDVPAGVDYELYVHGGGSCDSCVLRSENGAGVDEEIVVSWGDTSGSQARNVYVEVRFYGGSTIDCGDWTLTIDGNPGAPSANC